jgi:nucleoid-associated protein YgaU
MEEGLTVMADSFEPKYPAPQRGKLQVVENPPASGATEVAFLFNPTKLSFSAQAKWEQPSQSGAKKASAPTYKGPEAQTMELELLFDAWDASHGQCNVKKAIEDLVSWTKPTDSSRGQTKPKAPIVKLVWGPIEWFPAYVQQVDVSITMFDTEGAPLRATVKVKMKEMPRPSGGQNPTSGSRVGHQSYATVHGDTLAGIAGRHYGKPSFWRGLAVANGIDDPKRIPPGTRVYMPPIDEVSEASK